MLKFYIIILIFLVVLSIPFLKYQCMAHTKNKDKLYRCKDGKYRGIVQDFKTWRKVAQDEAKKQHNNRLQVLAQLGNDEEVSGVLYILGIELEEI